MGTLSVLETVRELYMSLTAILFNLVFLGFLQAQGYQHLRAKRAFRNLTLMVAVANIASCVDILFLVSDLYVPPVLAACTSVAVTITNHLMTLFFSIYFVRFFGMLEEKDYDVPVVSYLVAGIKMVVLAIWLFWAIPYILRTGERVYIPELMETVVGYGFNTYHIAYCLIFFVRKRGILRRRTRYAAMIGFVVVISTIVLQTVIGYVPHLYYLGATIALLIFYFTMESRPVSEIVVPEYARKKKDEAQQKQRAQARTAAQAESAGAEELRSDDGKEGVRRRSIIGTVFAIVSVLILGSYIVLGVLLYKRSEEMFLRELKDNALHHAKTIAASVDAKAFSGLYDGCQGNEDYNSVMDTLCLFRDNSGLQYVYTTWYDENGIPVMCVDSDPVAPGEMGDAIGYAEATHLALHGTPAVYDTPVTDDWGAHLSAFAPITYQGTVYGAVGVDVDYSWVKAQLNGIVVLILLTCAVCFAVTVFILMLLGRYLRQRFDQLNDQINVLSYDAGGMRKIEQSGAGDEFDMIVGHINEIFEQNAVSQMEEADKLRSAMAEVEKKAEETLAQAKELRRGMPADAVYAMPVEVAVRMAAAEESIQAAGEQDAQDAAGSEAETVRDAQPAAEQTEAAPAMNTMRTAESLLPALDENTSKEEAIRRVREALPQLLADYRSLQETLGTYFGPLKSEALADESLPEIDPEELQELYEAIAEFAGMYDADAINRLLQQTEGYSIPEAERERFTKVRECVEASDWIALADVLSV